MVVAAALAGLMTLSASAVDLEQGAFPGKWIEGYLPEKMAKVESPSYFSKMECAKQLATLGRYKQALILISQEKLAGPIASWAKGYAQLGLGRYDEAIETLSDAALDKDEPARVLLAKVYASRGNHKKSAEVLEKVLSENPKSIIAATSLGQEYESLGQFNKAKAIYTALHDAWWDKWVGMGTRLFEDADSYIYFGRAMDRWATLTGEYANGQNLQKDIFRMFVQAYDVIDRSSWQAHVAAAECQLTRENEKEAAKELKEAIKINPVDAHTLAMTGELSLAKHDFESADKAIQAIQEIDPENREGLSLEARSLLRQRRPIEAMKVVEKLLKTSSDDPETLGLQGAINWLVAKPQEVEKIRKKAMDLNSEDPRFFFAMGQELDALWAHRPARELYESALARAPWMSGARNALGFIMINTDEPAKAKAMLESAMKFDPYNFRTLNYLRVLDVMEKMDRKQTEHFRLVYSQKADPVLNHYILDFMESIYDQAAKRFAHEVEMTEIDVFATQEQFSARMTGAPGTPAQGICVGRTLGLATFGPIEGASMEAFDWSRVLRHEYTHTITLDATEFRIPLWMTEGLAMSQMKLDLDWAHAQLLYHAVETNDLLDMNGLNMGFIHPRSGAHQQLAYIQSQWVCEYITEKYTDDAIRKLLVQFKEGKLQEEAMPSVLGVSVLDFEKQFVEYAKKRTAGWGMDKATTKKCDDMKKKGQELIDNKQYDEALKVWEEIHKLRPVDPLPAQRLAFLYLNKKEDLKGIEMLDQLFRANQTDNRFAKRIARLWLDRGDAEKALQYAHSALYINLYDLSAHELTLEIAKKMKNDKIILRESAVIPDLTRMREEARKATLMPGAPTP